MELLIIFKKLNSDMILKKYYDIVIENYNNIKRIKINLKKKCINVNYNFSNNKNKFSIYIEISKKWFFTNVIMNIEFVNSIELHKNMFKKYESYKVVIPEITDYIYHYEDVINNLNFKCVTSKHYNCKTCNIKL